MDFYALEAWILARPFCFYATFYVFCFVMYWSGIHVYFRFCDLFDYLAGFSGLDDDTYTQFEKRG